MCEKGSFSEGSSEMVHWITDHHPRKSKSSKLGGHSRRQQLNQGPPRNGWEDSYKREEESDTATLPFIHLFSAIPWAFLGSLTHCSRPSYLHA